MNGESKGGHAELVKTRVAQWSEYMAFIRKNATKKNVKMTNQGRFGKFKGPGSTQLNNQLKAFRQAFGETLVKIRFLEDDDLLAFLQGRQKTAMFKYYSVVEEQKEMNKFCAEFTTKTTTAESKEQQLADIKAKRALQLRREDAARRRGQVFSKARHRKFSEPEDQINYQLTRGEEPSGP